MHLRIRHIQGRQILDSRGRPTVEADVILEGGATGRASVPSGASTGAAEAHELRDGDPAWYDGRGVLKAVAHVNGTIVQALRGADAGDQAGLDRALRELDGTENFSRLGANATLAVSLAACRAAAAASGQPFHRRIQALSGVPSPLMPVPMTNILSGGLHAGRGMDVQDFLAVPLRASSAGEAIHTLWRMRAAADSVARRRGLPTLLADEGGLGPGLRTGREALLMMVECMEAAGLRPGEDVGIAIDVAASSLADGTGAYRLAREEKTASAGDMIEMVEQWVREFPVVSIEDPLGEEDWDNWQALTRRLRDRVQLVGDDLFTTHPARLQRGIELGAGNAVLVKPNQNGTVSGTLAVVAQARAAGYATIVSARSGETEDAFMSDIAAGCAAGQIKIGSLRTSSTVAKYNQLLRIEEYGCGYAGVQALAGRGAR